MISDVFFLVFIRIDILFFFVRQPSLSFTLAIITRNTYNHIRERNNKQGYDLILILITAPHKTITFQGEEMKYTDKYAITDIYWDRMWIYFRITPADMNDLPPDTFRPYIINTDGSYKAFLKHEETGLYKLNITNPGNCKMLPVGEYRISYEAVTGGRDPQQPEFLPYVPAVEPGEAAQTTTEPSDTVQSAAYAGETAQTTTEPNDMVQSTAEADETAQSAVDPIQDLSVEKKNKRFLYFHSEREYRVAFSNEDGFCFISSDGLRTDKKKVLKLKTRLERRRHRLAKSVLRSVYNIYYFLYKKLRFSGSKKRILLFSDQSEQISSNMAALKKALIREGYKPDEAFRAITTRHYSFFHWVKTLKKLAKADFIFMDDHSQTTDWLTLKKTTITQLWHAGAGFKSTGYSRFGMAASPAPLSGHRQYTYGIAGSRKIRHFFSEVWGINDTMVLPAGMPRLDEYLNETYRKETTEKLLSEYPLLKKRVILFAPTYRGANKKHAYYPYKKLDFADMYQAAVETDSVFVFKMHPFVTQPVPIPEEYKDRMLDISAYPNINDLFYATDLLITDYSSNIYEFSLMRKPMLFFAYDIKGYSKSRGFHRDYRTNVPGRITENCTDMCEAIRQGDFEYEKVEEYIANNFEQTDTHACDRIIDWIVRGKLPEEFKKDIREELKNVQINA